MYYIYIKYILINFKKYSLERRKPSFPKQMYRGLFIKALLNIYNVQSTEESCRDANSEVEIL